MASGMFREKAVLKKKRPGLGSPGLKNLRGGDAPGENNG